MYKKKLITPEELEEYRKCSFEGRNLPLYIPEGHRISSILSRYFRIRSIFYGTEPYLKDKFPVHILGKTINLRVVWLSQMPPENHCFYS